ncbi:Metal-dependent membrane protease, CAAX family [Halorhabdus sp. BNX81]|nr:Metal-dependent membrane protease, CAAX family [Halorhabdus sp. BNX81]
MVSEPRADRTRLRAIGLAAGWALIGFLGSQIFAAMLYIPISPALGSIQPTMEQALLTAFSGIGFVLVAIAYLRVNDLNVEYIDVRFPSLRDIGYTILGVVVLLVGIVLISLLFIELGIESSEHQIFKDVTENNNPELLLAFVPLSLLVIGPAEELIYRNVVQKSLYDQFDRRLAVIIASVLFALVHFPAYLTSTPLEAASSVVAVFFLALVLGEWYRRTDNLVVPILVHGLINAIQFALQYVQIRYELAEATLTALM